MNEVTTTDLSEFGYRELAMANDLLTAMLKNGLPENFEDDKVTIMFNRNSGNVFLTNSEFQVAMMNGEDLEMWYYLPYGGKEGFVEDLKNLDLKTLNKEDIDFMVSMGIIEEEEEEI